MVLSTKFIFGKLLDADNDNKFSLGNECVHKYQPRPQINALIKK
jgi:hypothetical protein